MVGREPQARLGLLVQVLGRSRVVVYGFRVIRELVVVYRGELDGSKTTERNELTRERKLKIPACPGSQGL